MTNYLSDTAQLTKKFLSPFNQIFAMRWKIICLLVLLFIPVFAYADGCCTNPDSNFEFAICQQVPEQICCGDDSSCSSNYFYEGESCYSA
ncbi:MAG: hypothetical protein ACOCQ4_03385, partial [bacterium]